MFFTYDESIFSDYYKDTYGFRPRDHEFFEATPERKQEIWDELGEEFAREQERVELEKQLAIEAFLAEIQRMFAWGAKDRTQALRWMTQNDKFAHEQDVEAWVWDRGILFTPMGRDLVKELNDIVEFEEWVI